MTNFIAMFSVVVKNYKGLDDEVTDFAEQGELRRARGNFAERGASRTIVGNYERNSNTPSIEILLKIAKVFNVSVDYLIGEGKLSSYDKEVLKRIEDIEQLAPETRKNLFFLIDNSEL